MINSKFVLVFTILSLGTSMAVLLGQNQQMPRGDRKDYYQMEDFGVVKKFDVHIHINTSETHFIQQAIEDNFFFLDIVDDRPFGLPMDKQQELAILHLKNFPYQMKFATTFAVANWDQKDWVERTLSLIHISEPTRRTPISYAVFCLKKKKHT